MARFVLEIGVEEMPARFLSSLAKELKDLFFQKLQDTKIQFSDVSSYATPRRLVVYINDLAPYQDEEEQVIIGPPVKIALDENNKPTRAGSGFARSQGVDIEDTFVLDTDKGQYLAVRKKIGGAATYDILPEICVQVISALTFPKKMRWAGDFTFGRPIRWLLALMDDKEVKFQVADLESGQLTYGHRVMGPGPFTVNSARDYFQIIESQGRVVLDFENRKKIIREQGDKLATEVNGQVAWKSTLLDQVANLVEYPEPVLGRFDPEYLELPQEVLLTSMETHQKSFGLRDENGRLLPYFLTIINIDPEDLDLVRKGWERVLKARLEDARFFWEADCKTPLKVWLDELEKVIFLAPLGSMGDKSRRLQRLAAHLAGLIFPDMEKDLARAGRLAKTDLVSEMVGEFPDLQGIMGGIYARLKGESEAVSRAVSEHYLPAGQDSPIPQSKEGALLAIADKIDTMVGCFGLKMIPTGAADPYALRRQALGVIRIILGHDLFLSLSELIDYTFAGYENVEWKISFEELKQELLNFFGQRLKAYWTGQGYATRVVDAVLGAGFDNIKIAFVRLKALADFSQKSYFEQAVLTFKRADNIIRKQGEKLGEKFTGDFNFSLLEEPAEKNLAEKIGDLVPVWEKLWLDQDFAGLFELLLELRPVVDEFFDHVMVMCEDKDLRLNRLNLLFALTSRLSKLADFSALQV
jgi:glycyl-tRNA synthetase beta chain